MGDYFKVQIESSLYSSYESQLRSFMSEIEDEVRDSSYNSIFRPLLSPGSEGAWKAPKPVQIPIPKVNTPRNTIRQWGLSPVTKTPPKNNKPRNDVDTYFIQALDGYIQDTFMEVFNKSRRK